MLKLNFLNVEDLIFRDEKTWPLFPPRARTHFDTWKLAKLVPVLRAASRASVLDVLNTIDDDTVARLENYFGSRIEVEKLHYNVVKHLKVPLGEGGNVCEMLCGSEGFRNLTTWRDADSLYVSFWR